MCPNCGNKLNGRGQCMVCGYCSGWQDFKGIGNPKGKYKIKRSD